uniref:SusD/RagB family nutrient-binding outer membrane lipoprotein n=1 Tax=Roseihalotalea indica TaxID=2867963 RepID=A0AA49Q066_9BACT|nr:SusD/RagB family nutrient-binding outer membrane lipoprotein [Tunicatimonas sp. TK19036]
MNIKIKLLSAILTMLLVSACDEGFDEMNVHPKNPTDVSSGDLFNQLISTSRFGGDEQLYLNNSVLMPWTQLGTNYAINNVQVDRKLIEAQGVDNVWDNYYRDFLANARDLERKLDEYVGDAERNRNRKAMLYVLRAYRTLRLTDLFGDIPYSQAAMGLSDTYRPVFDSQESIYAACLEDLKWAADNITMDAETPNGESYFNYGVSETLFNNDLLMWQKFANALRLRYAMRMSAVNESGAQAIISEVLDGGLPLPETLEEEIGYKQDEIEGLQIGSRYWSWQYEPSLRMSTTVMSQMADDFSPDGSTVFDPRFFVYFETNADGEYVPAPPSPAAGQSLSIGGVIYESQRRTEPEDASRKDDVSGFNYYMLQDETSVPEIHVSLAEVLFLKAEAYARGYASGDAKAAYEAGIRASVEKWYNYAQSVDLWVNPPEMPAEEEIAAMLMHPKIAYNPANGLQQIAVQRWIDLIFNAQEAYHLLRRTGLIPLEEMQSTETGQMIEVGNRIHYPQSESEFNTINYQDQTARMNGGDVMSAKIWWDVN